MRTAAMWTATRHNLLVPAKARNSHNDSFNPRGHMARIEGIQPKDAGLFTRFAYWFTKRAWGHVMEGVKIAAHSPRLLRGIGQMEMAQAKLKSVDPVLVALAEIKVATMIGCPF